MQQALTEIEMWLKKNARKIHKHSLNPPATENQLNELEKLVGSTLPDDFKMLYQWHNGLNTQKNFGSLFYGYNFWDLDTVIQYYQSNLDDKEYRESVVEYCTDCDKAINLKGFIDNPKWIQFAHDGSRTGFYLDLNPDESGVVGQVIFLDFDSNVIFVMANSVSDFVQQVNADMQAGHYYLDEDVLEDGDHFLGVDSEIDILNWHSSERWKR